MRQQALEKEVQALKESLGMMRVEKQGLEFSLYETQAALSQLEARKEQLEGENQTLLLKREALTTQLNQLKKDSAIETEGLKNERDALREQIEQMVREHAKKIKNLEKDLEAEMFRKDEDKVRFRTWLLTRCFQISSTGV